MLTFLRKIRRSLIESSSFRKYILYAIGEIALVVIGILIALQINKWNEYRRLLSVEQSYYCKIMEDVRQDAVQIQDMIRVVERRRSNSNDLIHLLQQEEIDRPLVMIKVLESLSLITSTFVPSQAAFEDLKSSGNLKTLRDADLKQRIIDYYLKIDGLIDVADYHANEAVRQLYGKSDFTAVGWHHLEFVKEGIDTAKVKLEHLDKFAATDDDFRKSMMSDGVLYVGANHRIINMYELIAGEIESLKVSLMDKCPIGE